VTLRSFWINLILLIFLSREIFAADLERFRGKTVALDAVVGFPQMMGLELSYVGWGYLVPGISFGSAPIQGLLSKQVNLNPIPVQLPLADQYAVYPSSNFSLYSFSLFLKYFFPSSGFYFNFIYSTFTFSGSVSGGLKNETNGQSYSGIIDGNARLTQRMFGGAMGYQFIFGSNLFLETALGAGYLFNPSYSFSVGGSAVNALGVLPGGAENLNSAKSNVQSSFDSAVEAYRSALKVIPFVYLNFGFTF
jgi:hypothetical protein